MKQEKAQMAMTSARIRDARALLLRYQQGKRLLERRLVENERYWRLQHWDCMDRQKPEEPTSAWLWNVLANKHADMTDAYPTCSFLPREEDDRAEAQRLSAIVPVILKQNRFFRVYSDTCWSKLKAGFGVYGVFWDGNACRGLGDVVIRRQEPLHLFWAPGVSDIQDSPALFVASPMEHSALLARYPQLRGRLDSDSLQLTAYAGEDPVDRSRCAVVVDWYYKVRQKGRTVVHYCKFAGEQVLYATENETAPGPDGRIPARDGLYDHGMYPFVFDPLYRIEGSPAGFGFVDICKSPQRQIDRLNRAIAESAAYNAVPRYFSRIDAAVDEAAFLDPGRKLIPATGNLGADSLRPVDRMVLPGIYITALNGKIDELKETAGNRDVATGGTTGGVTAASGIAAMQEASGKLSRDMLRNTYDAFEAVCSMIVELIRQFYTAPRCFRITGEHGKPVFLHYSNQGLWSGGQLGPEFDLEITAQKASPYTKLSQNELMLQFYQLGFFQPGNAAQAAVCLEGMDFDGKEALLSKIRENGSLQERLSAVAGLALELAKESGQTDASDKIRLLLTGTSAPAGRTSEPHKTGESRMERARAAANQAFGI